ncbi:MAG: CvpA family protein [Campylobacterota bacterium]|nr:CvpA family protein [Campylobacterota bacterium]
MENINIFDIVVLTLIVILGLKGLFRGLTKELFGLIGIVGGVFVASRLASDVGEVVNSVIPMENNNTITLVGFVVSIVLFWVLAYLIGMVLEKVFSASGLGVFDRLFGFIFGAGKIFLLFSVISYAVTQVKVINDVLVPKLQASTVFPILTQTGSYILKLDTSNFQKEVTKQLDVVVDSAKETIEDISKEELAKRAQELKEQLMEQPSEK